jgi:hypothetical protein
MAHFYRDILVTSPEVEPKEAAPPGPSGVVANAERAKGLAARLLGAQQSVPELTEPKPSSTLEEPSSTLELSAPKPTDCAMPDPLIQGLVDRLPKPDSVWSLNDRGKWLKAAAVIFTLIYKLDEEHSSEPKA